MLHRLIPEKPHWGDRDVPTSAGDDVCQPHARTRLGVGDLPEAVRDGAQPLLRRARASSGRDVRVGREQRHRRGRLLELRLELEPEIVALVLIRVTIHQPGML